MKTGMFMAYTNTLAISSYDNLCSKGKIVTIFGPDSFNRNIPGTLILIEIVKIGHHFYCSFMKTQNA